MKERINEQIKLCEKILAVLNSCDRSNIIVGDFCGENPGEHCTFGALGKSVGMSNDQLEDLGFYTPQKKSIREILTAAGLQPDMTCSLANHIVAINDGYGGDDGSLPWDRVHGFVSEQLARLRKELSDV